MGEADTKNWLIYGHEGWIGQQVTKLLDDRLIQYILSPSRADDTRAVKAEIKSDKVSHVLCFIGRTHGKIGDKEYNTIDYLENEGKLMENVRDNLFSPIQLALICAEYGKHFTYMGTGCIFEYDKKHEMDNDIVKAVGYNETDKPNFFGSSYSIIKGFTDRLMHIIDEWVLNLRIRMPITGAKHPRNFITKITNYDKICSIPNSMTVLDEMLPYMVDMIKREITGTYNFTNPGSISHNEILSMYKEIVDRDFTWKNFTIEDQSEILYSGRSNNYLDTSNIQSLYPDIKLIRESVRDVLVKYKN